MENGPQLEISAIDANSESKLRIRHFILWAFIAAVFFSAQRLEIRADAELIRWEGVLRLFAFIDGLTSSLAITAMISIAICLLRHRLFLSKLCGGHWLAVQLAMPAIIGLGFAILCLPVVHEGQTEASLARLDYLLSLLSAVISVVLFAGPLVTRIGNYWALFFWSRIVFVLVVAIAEYLLYIQEWSSYLVNTIPELINILSLGLLILGVISDRRISQDWRYWAGVMAFLIRVTWSIVWNMLVWRFFV